MIACSFFGFYCLNNTLSAICNTEIKATVAQDLQAEEFDNSFTNKKRSTAKVCQSPKGEGSDNSNGDKNDDSNEDSSYNNNDDNENDNNKEDEDDNNNNTSILADKINKLAVELETSKIGGTKNCANQTVLMKPVVYSWLDETGS